MFQHRLPASFQLLHERGHRELVNLRNVATGDSMLE
jgi:hypothetical protein